MNFPVSHQEAFYVASIMSGTSLDGTDIAFCKFQMADSWRWKYQLLKAETFEYSTEWRNRLVAAETMSGRDLMLLNKEYGKYLGRLVSGFFEGAPVLPHYIASHGHTIFHQPESGLTFQLGDGASIAATCGFNTISDFRNLDVALGGQGAPLVPIGDRLLFGEYDACLNLGGFANISYETNGKRIAYDICPVNIILNHHSRKYHQAAFDQVGLFGKAGFIDQNLLESLNDIPFYKSLPPKSLGKEWVLSTLLPVLEKSKASISDQFRTLYEHIAVQLSIVLNRQKGKKVLVTGGGVFNSFLTDLIKMKTDKTLVFPEKEVIEFKEAIIFAFLGVLRVSGIPNCLASVTGASFDNCGGMIYFVNSFKSI